MLILNRFCQKHPASARNRGSNRRYRRFSWSQVAFARLAGMQNVGYGHLHPVVVFRDPAGFKITRQVWMKANCDSEALAKILLQKHT